MLYTASFSPINFKLGIFFSLSIFFYILLSCKRKQAIILSYIYGVSIFTSGVSWIYTSIYYYGGGSLVTSLLMTVSLIMFLSLFIAPLGFFLNKHYKDKSLITLLVIPSAWVALELFRSIILGGFPWLIAGHSQEGTIFNIIYPIAGSYFVSLLICTISIGTTYTYNSNLMLNYVSAGLLFGTEPSSAAIQQYGNAPSPNGEMTITNIDYTNNTIDGNFSFNGYNMSNQAAAPKLVNCSFSGIPCYVIDM